MKVLTDIVNSFVFLVLVILIFPPAWFGLVLILSFFKGGK